MSPDSPENLSHVDVPPILQGAWHRACHELRHLITAIHFETDSLTHKVRRNKDVVQSAERLNQYCRLLDKAIETASEVFAPTDLLHLQTCEYTFEFLATEVQQLIQDQRQSIRWPKPHIVVRGELTSPPPGSVSVDMRSFRQTVGELLSNAAKYADPDTVVEIEATFDLDCIRLLVTNICSSIDPELPIRAFDYGWRSKDAAAASSGLGIGLATARRLAKLSGWRLTLSTSGSSIIVSLVIPRGSHRD